MSHTWPGAVPVFDSRWWNGVMPVGTPYLGYIAKATEGDDFVSAQFATQYRAAEVQFGRARGAWSFHRAVSNPTAAARMYHSTIMANGGYGGFPPIIDLEDRRAPASVVTVNHMQAQLDETEQLAGQEVLCYTAQWIWSRWAPFVQSRHTFYQRKLWEADPEPDTIEPGRWTKESLVMVQVRLDFNPGGFNAVIDESAVRPEWFDAVVGQPGPNPGLPEAIGKLKVVQSELGAIITALEGLLQ